MFNGSFTAVWPLFVYTYTFVLNDIQTLSDSVFSQTSNSMKPIAHKVQRNAILQFGMTYVDFTSRNKEIPAQCKYPSSWTLSARTRNPFNKNNWLDML